MIIVSKKSDVTAQFEIFSRFYIFALKSYPETIQSVPTESLQTLLATVYSYESWKQLTFDLNPINSKKVEQIVGVVKNNTCFYKQLNKIKLEFDLNGPTTNLIKNLLSNIIEIEIRSGMMYASWYYIFNCDTALVEHVKDRRKLFPLDDMNMGNLIDLSMSHLVLKSYSRYFNLSQPEKINNWIFNRNEIIDKKLKFHLDMNMTSDYVNLGKLFPTVAAIDPSQNARNNRYMHGERLNVTIPINVEVAFSEMINVQMNARIVSEQGKRIHGFLTRNREVINQAFQQNLMPDLNTRSLLALDRTLIKSYIKATLWLMNQIVGLDHYYGLYDILVNYNGLIVARPAYRNDLVVKPYRIFQKHNRLQPDLVVKKMVTSFDMTKLIYHFFDELKDRSVPEIFQYIDTIYGVMDEMEIEPAGELSRDISTKDISKRIDINFKAEYFLSLD